MAECPRQKPDSQRLLQKLLKLPPPLQPSVFTCSAGYQTGIANLASPEPTALPLPFLIHNSYGRGQCTIAQVLLTTQVTHLCISSSGSLLDLSRVYHLIYQVWPEPSTSLSPLLSCQAIFSTTHTTLSLLHTHEQVSYCPYFRCSLCPSSCTEAQRDWKFSKPLCNVQTPFPSFLFFRNARIGEVGPYMIHPMNLAQMSSFLSGTHYSVFLPRGSLPHFC